MDVADACRKSSFVEIHELKSLNDEQSLKLFNKRAFYDLNGCCPENLVDISSKIVEKCDGLPLAIVVTGALLSCKGRDIVEWNRFNKNLNLELHKNSMMKLILGLSFHDMSYNLKSCFLYFGLYPEDSIVPSNILTQQWMAEGFVKEDRGRTLEEVAEGYLTELIRRNLVQVHSIGVDGRAKSCRVHDLVHAMILEKCEDLSFCTNISEEKKSSFTRMVRPLSLDNSSINLLESIENSHVRSLVVYKPLSVNFIRKIPTKYRQLKVLNMDHDQLLVIPTNLGSLSHLKYFRFHNMQRTPFLKFSLPESIAMLENLETLDLAETRFADMPKEICKLRKLRHFKGFNMSLIQLKDGIGGMTSLQTLSGVYLDEDEDENDNRVVELIKELGKLKQLRELGLFGVKFKYMNAISSSIDEMQQLEKLCIRQSESDDYSSIDMDLNSPPPMLRKVKLDGMLEKFPEWISKLQNLAKLKVKLMYSKQMDDVLKLLTSMPNLFSLHVSNCDYEDKFLHFQNGWFKNLKELCLENFNNLSNILIDEGAFISLKKLQLFSIPQLKTLPKGIQHLKNLEILNTGGMSVEFMQSIAPNEGKAHWIFKQVPFVDTSGARRKIPNKDKLTENKLRNFIRSL